MRRLNRSLQGLSLRKTMLVAFLIGAVMALGQAPWGLWPLTLIGFVLVTILLEGAASTRKASFTGWAVGCGYFAVTLSWIVEPFLVDIARHGWMAPFALFLMAGGLALFWGAAFGFARWMGQGRYAGLALVVTLPFAELARAYVFTGFPWGMPAYIWVGLAPMQLVALIGSHGVNVLTLMMTAGVWSLSGMHRPTAIMLGIVSWGLSPLFVLFTSSQTPVLDAEQPLLRLLQPNAPQHLKWDPDWIPVFFDRNLEFTADPGRHGRPDLIIWPETSVPSRLSADDYAITLIRDAANGVPVVFGIGHERGDGYFNSMAVMDDVGALTQTYDKMHLVPFGEYVPFSDLMARFGIYGLAATQGYGFTPGEGAQLLDLGSLGKAMPLICYEAVFPQDLNAAPDGADWILQITNDAWFGTISGPWQHLAQARFRAVEQGKPLVRVANTGVTALISARGDIRAQLPFGTEGYLDVRLPPAGGETLYRRTGDWPVLLILLFFCGVLTLSRDRSGNRS